MYCKHCGSKIDQDAKFCSNCGKAVAAAPSPKKSRKTIIDHFAYTASDATPGKDVNLDQFKEFFRDASDSASPQFKELPPTLRQVVKEQLHFTNLELFDFSDSTNKKLRGLFSLIVLAGYASLAVPLEGELVPMSDRKAKMKLPIPVVEDAGELWGKYGTEMWSFFMRPFKKLDDYFYELIEKTLPDEVGALDSDLQSKLATFVRMNVRMGAFMAVEQGFLIMNKTNVG